MEQDQHSRTRGAGAITVQNNIANDQAIQFGYPINLDVFEAALDRQYERIPKKQQASSAPVLANDSVGEVTGILRDLAQALASFAASSKWAEHPETPRHWKSGAVEVTVGSGSGQDRTNFSLSLADFVRYCVDAGFSTSFLGRLAGRCSMFEHQLLFTQTGDMLSCLELAMATYEVDSFLLLLRIDYHKKRTKALVFLKPHDSLREEANAISLDGFIRSLEQSSSAVANNPLLIANHLLSFFQRRSFLYAKWRYDLYAMESRLGVTKRAEIFKEAGYETVSFEYDKLNADLAWLSRRAAEVSLSASTIRDQAAALLRLMELLEAFRDDSARKDLPSKTYQASLEEIRSTILRSELFLENMAMADNVLESLRAVLYNRLSKHDSDSMKTIAVVTLFFLPATLVSSIFSTGVFDFHATEGDERQTISRWAWVYLLVCIVLTCITLAIWLCWYRWGSLWLEKLHLTRVHLTAQPKQTSQYSMRSTKDKDIERGNAAAVPRSLQELVDQNDRGGIIMAEIEDILGEVSKSRSG